MKTIMIAIDFSDVSGFLIDAGIKLAKAFGAEVKLVHTEPPESGYFIFWNSISPNSLGYYSVLPAEDIEIRHKTMIENAQHALDIVKSQFIDNHIKTETILMEGSIVSTLTELINDTGTDLLIIGNHKHGGFFNFLFNDIGQSIISHADCNVLVIKTNNDNPDSREF